MALLPMLRNKNNKSTESGDGTRTIIDKGTSIAGDISTQGNLLIDGELTGDIKSQAKVVLGESAHVFGHLVAKNAVIEGEIKGNVYVSEQLTLGEKAIVHGDIFALRMHMEPGAKLNGVCQIGQAPKIPQKLHTPAPKDTITQKLKLEEPAAVNGAAR